MRTPPSRVCPLCGDQDFLDAPVPLPEAGWQFVCHGPHGTYVFEVTPANEISTYPEGLAAELGLYDDLPKCVTEQGVFVEYGIVEYRYGVAHPEEYEHLIDTYGHRAVKPKPYTASAFIAGVLGRLASDGTLQLDMAAASGYWSYNGTISYWAPPSVVVPAVHVTWQQFAIDAGLDPSHWPLLTP